MSAAVFHGRDYSENLHSIKNTDEKPTVKKLFDVSQKLIREQGLEISGGVRNKLKKFFMGKAVPGERRGSDQSLDGKSLYSQTLCCLGRVCQFPEPNEDWKTKLNWFQNSKQYRKLVRLDGEPMELEWIIFPGFTTLQILLEIQQFMEILGCEPENFQGRFIFMSMYNEIIW